MGAQQIIQARIAAQQDLDAIIYGQRTAKAMGGCRNAAMAQAEWARAQWIAAREAAARYGEHLEEATGGMMFNSADWRLKKAKKAATEALATAKAAEKALGTKKQLRLALAA